ncbi:MAG TPA: nickel-type superoxide dismutase maturation protease [Acidimicrobiales bacterium]|jgi:nickel-type superoxide dismutase maturation protease|nr:nickel-type superoxide dismutase maturation protease [Acidimicrobiales bacterium]
MNKPWRRVEVHGDSMRPALQPGDRLLVVRWPRLRPGHLVALARPDRVVVKRVQAVDHGMVTVAGDNAEASTDSRHFGPVPRAHVLGRAVYRYAPTGRAGRLH